MTYEQIFMRIDAAHKKYGALASTHEALGVASEEWDELRAAIHANNIGMVRNEALDLAAVMIRLADSCNPGSDFHKRSIK